jgi:hypothetical protein
MGFIVFVKSAVALVAVVTVCGLLAAVNGCDNGTSSGGGGGGSGAASAPSSSGSATAPAPTAQASTESMKSATPESPKAVALAFSRALSAGDVARAKELSTGDAGPQMLEALTKLAAATAELQKALKETFGDKAKDLEIFTESPDPAEELSRSTETITGDTAVIALSPTDRNASSLKKVDGHWKYDITKFAQSQRMRPQLEKMADAWSGLAKDVGAGKYATVEDFAPAFTAKTNAAASGG